MSDFETIPDSSQPEKSEQAQDKKEEKKPTIEIEDWSVEPPAPEPKFFRTADDAAQETGQSQPVEPESVADGEVQPAIEAIESPEPIPTDFVNESKPVEPEVIDLPPNKYQGAEEPPKKNNAWWIVLIVVLVLLCLCCVIVVVVGALFGNLSTDSTSALIQLAFPI